MKRFQMVLVYSNFVRMNTMVTSRQKLFNVGSFIKMHNPSFNLRYPILDPGFSRSYHSNNFNESSNSRYPSTYYIAPIAFSISTILLSLIACKTYEMYTKEKKRKEHRQQLKHMSNLRNYFPLSTKTPQYPPSIIDRMKMQLNSFSSAEKIIYGLVFTQAVILVAWRIPAMEQFMARHFMSRTPLMPLNARPWQGVPKTYFNFYASSFSHIEPFHLFMNMVGFLKLGIPIYGILGQRNESSAEFVFFLSSAACVSSLTSYLTRLATFQRNPSLGFSGIAMGLFGAYMGYAYQHNERSSRQMTFHFFGLPSMTPQQMLNAVVLSDILIAFLLRRFVKIDLAAHLGGVLFGFAYTSHLRNDLWDNAKISEEARRFVTKYMS